MTLNVLGICGSLRAASLNHAALRLAGRCMPDGMRLHLTTLTNIPMFNGDVLAHGLPDAVASLREDIRAADALLIASPEYNFSVPGVLKNALDWVSRGADQPLVGKPVALMSASMGMLGGARMQYDLRKTLMFLEPHVLVKPEVFIGAAHTKFTADGECTDAGTCEIVGQQMAALRDWVLAVQRLKTPG